MPDQLGLACEWYARLSEPVRVRPRRPEPLNYIFRSPFKGPFRELLNDWYRPLSEPVRRKPPLGPHHSPYYFALIHIIGYSFSISERPDSAILQVGVYPPKHWAKVTVTEQSVLTSEVTVQEISYKRKYF